MDPIVGRWLDSLASSTRRAYRRDVEDLMSYAGSELREMTAAQVAGWKRDMRARGLAASTVNRKLSAASSFFRFAARHGGWDVDPVGEVRRMRVSPYGRARYPTVGQVQRLLEVIPLGTVQGKRDLAVLLGLFVTMRRVNEWVPLRWSQIAVGSEGLFFRYRGKGDREERQALPGDLWEVIVGYERAAGRWPLQGEAPLFVAHSANGGRLPTTGEDYAPGQEPISTGYVYRALRRYGRLAGVPAEVLHPHGLRHAGARYRKEAGASPWELQRLLGHRDLRTTMIYTSAALEDPQDEAGDAVVAAVLPRGLRWRDSSLRSE